MGSRPIPVAEAAIRAAAAQVAKYPAAVAVVRAPWLAAPRASQQEQTPTRMAAQPRLEAAL
ncbi:MAG: hypothetical protein ACKOCN_04630 [Planctomycetaceae bacterium]